MRKTYFPIIQCQASSLRIQVQEFLYTDITGKKAGMTLLDSKTTGIVVEFTVPLLPLGSRIRVTTTSQAGTCDMKLTVCTAKGNSSSTIHPALILVMDKSVANFTILSGCQSIPANFTDVSSANKATSIDWIVEPQVAGAIPNHKSSGTIEQPPGFTGDLTLQVKGVGLCGSGTYSNLFYVKVNEIPAVPAKPEGCDIINPNNLQRGIYFIHTGPTAAGYTWSIDPVIDRSLISGTHSIDSVFSPNYVIASII